MNLRRSHNKANNIFIFPDYLGKTFFLFFDISCKYRYKNVSILYIYDLPCFIIFLYFILRYTMLRVGDIHITHAWSEQILEKLRIFVKKYPHERHIVFFGDVVYHFQYDRKALLALFRFFIELEEQGKVIYVLAGNHDRLQGHFVYEEACIVLGDVVCEQGNTLQNPLDVDTRTDTWRHLYFVTVPTWFRIAWQLCLFFPFCQLSSYDIASLSSTIRDIPDEHIAVWKSLQDSSHAWERLSAKANHVLASLVSERKYSQMSSQSLMIFHHWYVWKTVFPGQHSSFGWKSPALDPYFCDIDKVKLVSGHIHHPFVYKHYCCLWSVWSSSPLEIDQQKFLRHYDDRKQVLTAVPCSVNPYVTLACGEALIAQDVIAKRVDEILHQTFSHLQQGERHVVLSQYIDMPVLKCVTMYLTWEWLRYEDLPEYIDPDLMRQLKDIKIKQKKQIHLLEQELQDASLDLEHSIADWKTLLRTYIQKKYTTESSIYLDLLQELKVI